MSEFEVKPAFSAGSARSDSKASSGPTSSATDSQGLIPPIFLNKVGVSAKHPDAEQVRKLLSQSMIESAPKHQLDIRPSEDAKEEIFSLDANVQSLSLEATDKPEEKAVFCDVSAILSKNGAMQAMPKGSGAFAAPNPSEKGIKAMEKRAIEEAASDTCENVAKYLHKAK